MPRKPIDMMGVRFAKLVVIGPSKSKNNQAMWECVCDCGKRFVASGASIRKGKTKSCGCYYRDSRVEVAHRSIAKTKHGDSFSRLYLVWADIKARCYNPNNISYKNYGAIGITMCNEWKTDYIKFKKWSLENGYDEVAARGTCTIDRIDAEGNYTPDNCRWVDMGVQSNNRRNTPHIEINGETHTPAEWASISGLSRGLIYSRYRRGWKGEEIISPVDQYRKRAF